MRAGEPRGAPRAALVTGSARGIGRALLLALAEDGYRVAVHYRASAAEAAAVADEARARGVDAEVFRADVTDEAQAQALVDEVAARFGRLDVLVNNVGDYHHGPLAELDAATWRLMLDSNLNATFYTSQRAAPRMQRQRWGRILNLGYSGAELLKARPGIVAYQIAKTGVILYTKALARTLAGSGVTANVISPGVMENSVTQPLREIPMGRTGRLEELVAAARYLWSEDAGYVTGITLEVAGGWNL